MRFVALRKVRVKDGVVQPGQFMPDDDMPGRVAHPLVEQGYIFDLAGQWKVSDWMHEQKRFQRKMLRRLADMGVRIVENGDGSYHVERDDADRFYPQPTVAPIAHEEGMPTEPPAVVETKPEPTLAEANDVASANREAAETQPAAVDEALALADDEQRPDVMTEQDPHALDPVPAPAAEADPVLDAMPPTEPEPVSEPAPEAAVEDKPRRGRKPKA